MPTSAARSSACSTWPTAASCSSTRPKARFVLRKAFEVGLRIIIVINKVDRANADPRQTLSRVHDLFLELAEDADQLEAPVIYSIAKEGRAGLKADDLASDLEPLFKTI